MSLRMGVGRKLNGERWNGLAEHRWMKAGVSRDYVGIGRTQYFGEAARWAPASRNEVNGRLPNLVFHAIITNFLEPTQGGMPQLEEFQCFRWFLPHVLFRGYAYLSRYMWETQRRFKSVVQLKKIFLVCCILSAKYELDVVISNSEIADRWGFDVGEINYIEALLMNVMNYNLCVALDEYNCCYNTILNCRRRSNS